MTTSACSGYRIIQATMPPAWRIFVVVSLACFARTRSYETFVPDDVPPGTLLNMVIDTKTGKVYLGAVNRLYQLSSDLRLEKSVVTGPKEDNPMCPPPTSQCQCDGNSCKEFEKVSMDSVSKTLVIDYRGERLISCSNLFQGHCDKHLLSDISQTDAPVWTMLVPNDEHSSVVMFIGPGPPNPASTDILYVAATRSTRGLPGYKDIVPAVCMRNLQDLDLVSDDILIPSRIDVEVQQRDQFRVDYVHGFGSLGFSYFLTVQRVAAITDSEKYITQILRICQNNKSLYSYTEVPLECHHAGVHYNILRAAHVIHPGTELAKSLGLPHIAPLTDMEHVLIGVFSAQPVSKFATDASAICVFPLRDIRRKFTETIQQCFHGIGNTGPDHFVQPKGCYKTPFEIGDDYCGQHDINHPIKGTEPVSRDAAITWSNVNATSIAVTVTSDFTVAFIGTENGHLRKVTISSGDNATEYDSLLVEPNTHINQDMAFDLQHQNVYVMNEKKVRLIPVQDCGRHRTCEQCLSARDPYCGWCTLERKCNKKTECPGADAASRWLPYHTGQCPKIVKMPSQQAQKQTSSATTLVVMTVQSLPVSSSGGGVYQCAFSGYGVTRTTSVVQFDKNDQGNSTLKCETPTANLLPAFPTGRDHILMNLSLMLDNQEFLATNFTFFDCSLHSTCTKCTTSAFPCWWCIERHRCTNNREKCPNSMVLVTGRKVQGKSDTPGPEYCPRIENTVNSSEILIASGTETPVKVRAVNLQSFQKKFKCVFNFKGGMEKSAHFVTDDNGRGFIECDSVLFEYTGTTHYINVPFNILWGESPQKSLDNPHNLQVQVFKCEEMASNCGRCRAIDVRHGCGWCSGRKVCSIQGHCADNDAPWRQRSDSCIDPSINMIHPVNGPVEGGTILTVRGENLGISVNDTVVTVAGVDCVVLQYEPSVQFTCRTGPAEDVPSGPVVVVISSQFTASSLQAFSYITPVITGFEPSLGPQSGGTFVTILGRNLDAGTSMSLVFSNETLSTSCEFVSRVSESAICITSSSLRPYQADIVNMTVDAAVITSNAVGVFNIVADPTIESAMPERSIFSGGTRVIVRGARLYTVAAPRMIVYAGEQNVTSPCFHGNDSIVCTAPNLRMARTPVTEPPSAEEPHYFHYGFIMDHVQTVLNLSAPAVMTSPTQGPASAAGQSSTSHLFTYFLDPTFEKFEDGIKQFFSIKNEYLTLNGKHINLGLTKEDLRVTIDDVDCVVTSISTSQLTCQPSEQQLENFPASASVKVHIGGNTSFLIGSLESPKGSNNFLLTWPVMVVGGAIAFVIVAIFIGVCIAYQRKSRESNDVMKRMKNQMDVLEARVAKECKEAFAELQTDMTEMTSDIGGQGGGIPFRDYRSFSMGVLFPAQSASDHPVVRPLDCDVVHTESLDTGMRLFNKLINHKVFLLLFIRSLEQNDAFAVREKVNVASLLSVILQNRMDYHTDILKTLLAELIEKAMEGKQHPKLLLRRTESVAEKMLTNWFTFLLYKFLRESAGEPLFVLFRAIKQQVDKGPTDALTSEARYALNEEKLIRQHIDYKGITLRVLDPETTMYTEPLNQPLLIDEQPVQEYTVKLLDCDTVSQVKEKMLDSIFKNAPFSSRPSKDELDLEWRTTTGRLILQDEDVTTKIENGEFKRLNTLAHYRVPENSLMALVPRLAPSLNSTGYHTNDRFPQFPRFGSLPTSHSMSSSNVMNAHFDNGAKQYHLVKSNEVDHHHHKEGEQGRKMASEIYLTRLLTTKGTLQQFVDDLFETIFSTSNRGSMLPLAIKHMFDFLDDQALNHGISDPEVVHTWKSNSLPLRFWVNVIKNPEFVFDIHKSNIVDSCLSVVAQTFMDSCSMSDHKLGKDSPSNKLLYAKDIPKYKKWVERYYEDIKQMPAISDQDMNAMLQEESRTHNNEFNTNAALLELYQYTYKYQDDLVQSLEDDEFARKGRLAALLNQVHNIMQVKA